jgi:hypothetical protein
VVLSWHAEGQIGDNGIFVGIPQRFDELPGSLVPVGPVRCSPERGFEQETSGSLPNLAHSDAQEDDRSIGKPANKSPLEQCVRMPPGATKLVVELTSPGYDQQIEVAG